MKQDSLKMRRAVTKHHYTIAILYQDDHIVVVNKPGGLLSVPGRGKDKQDCVVTRVKKLFPNMIDQPAVHRLDMFTSGLMVLAKTTAAHRELGIQFEKRAVKKTYISLLEGKIPGSSGRIELSFRLDVTNRPYQIYDPVQGKRGITLWQKLGMTGDFTRVAFTPVTGRTHQLRLHAAHEKGLGVPIVGDRLYGNGKEGDQMMLHASQLSFNHPASQQPLTFDSPPSF